MSSIVQTSKALSYVLRHRPERIGLTLDENGWASVDEILQKLEPKIDREMLEKVVAENDKKRFSFSPDGTKIRANQGHSIDVDLKMKPLAPPPVLFHGTASQFLPSIKKQGILKRKRHHVHLSADEMTASIVGKRHGHPVVLRIDSAKMAAEGIVFFQSDNGVWLTDFVEPRFYEVLN